MKLIINSKTVLGFDAVLDACKYVNEYGKGRKNKYPIEMFVPIPGSCGLVVRTKQNKDSYTMTVTDGTGDMQGIE